MLNETALDTLFFEARTQIGWQDQPVSDDQLRQLYALMKWGPTSANCSPARLVFVRTDEEKARLLACMMPGNVEKTRAAPVTVIIGMDMEFHENLPMLFPHADMRALFLANQALIAPTAFRNSSLQGGYFIMAARALGLDCTPMSGFDENLMNQTFFAGTSVKVNFVCSIGYGDRDKLFPRSPRLSFDEACKII